MTTRPPRTAARTAVRSPGTLPDDIVNALDYAIETPRHVNIGMIEIMPTFQVPGGLTFDRR